MKHLVNVPKEDFPAILKAWPLIVVEGPPEAVQGWTVAELEEIGLVGVYSEEDGEIRET